jgi:hypothetical protein
MIRSINPVPRDARVVVYLVEVRQTRLHVRRLATLPSLSTCLSSHTAYAGHTYEASLFIWA